VVRLSTEVRKILDDGGLDDAKIYSSGSLNEYRIAKALEAGAPIDAFGVGSHLAASVDSPELDMVYKLVEYDARPVLKLSPHKRTLAGPKQVFRRISSEREMIEDVLATRDEKIEGMEPLLVPVMKAGKRVHNAPSLAAIRENTMAQLSILPKELKKTRTDTVYPVRQSERLSNLQRRLVDEYRAGDSL
jgi:nicotinate phosphoribosyltransferase